MKQRLQSTCLSGCRFNLPTRLIYRIVKTVCLVTEDNKTRCWCRYGYVNGFNPSIPGYVFEYVPTPLASGGVGLYINDSLKYTVIEKVSAEAFQSLWIEIQLPQKSNIICGITYRQHNSPKRFQEYFDDKLERLITSKKSIYIMGDFNINLLHAANFLLCSGLLTFSSKLFIYPNY